jgi:hypothetical protein
MEPPRNCESIYLHHLCILGLFTGERPCLLAYTGSKPGKARKSAPLDSSVPKGNFILCFFKSLTEHQSTTFNGWDARNPVQEFGHHLSFISLLKHGYGRVSRRKHVHPVWLSAVAAFSSIASKNAEALGMGWEGFEVMEASMGNGLGRQGRVG